MSASTRGKYSQDPLEQAFTRLEDMLPAALRRALIWLHDPQSRWVRLPLGILCIIAGLLWFLPVVGLEYLPIGLLLVAQDVPFLRRPVGTGTLKLLDGVQRLIKWWKTRNHRGMALGSRATRARTLLACTIRNWLADKADTTGAALAFYCAFSIAPLLVIILTVVGWIVDQAAAFTFLHVQLDQLFGKATAKVVMDAVRQSQFGEGITAAVVSTATLLIAATTVLAALDEALEKILGGAPRKGSGIGNWVRRRVLSLGFILSLSFVLLVSLTVSTALAALRSWVAHSHAPLLGLLGIVDLLVSVALMTSLFALIYRYVPAQRLPWKQVAGGGLLTALLFSAGKWAVGLYLAKSTVPTAFGAAASFAALLLWLYYTAQIFLLGAEFTACLAGGRGGSGRRVEK